MQHHLIGVKLGKQPFSKIKKPRNEKTGFLNLPLIQMLTTFKVAISSYQGLDGIDRESQRGNGCISSL
jgi:hypothetical protein